jgi:hypothetical protein
VPAVVSDVAAPIAGAIQENIISPVAQFGRALFGMQPGQEGGQPPEVAQPGEQRSGLPIIPEQAPAGGGGSFRTKHEEFLRNQQARPMPTPRFTQTARRANPLEGVALPQLSGNVGIGDLMKFRLGMINAGVQLLPKVAQAAQEDTQFERGKDVAALGLKELEIGQRADIAASANAARREGHQTTLQAARIRAKGREPGMADIMKDVTAGQEFEELFPLSAADTQGNTTATVARNLADVYPADAVVRLARQLQDQSAQAGEVDLDTAENAQAFNARLAQTLDQMYPGRLPKVPQR